MPVFTKLKSKLFAGESGNVFKGMLTLLVGAGLARIVGLISIPVLARIYSPEDYGVLALYTSFVAILAPIMTLRYVQAIPLPKNDVIAFNLFALCFKLITFFSIVAAIVLTLFGETVLAWFDMEALMPWRWLIVLGAAGSALYELFSLWATRKRQYKTISKTQFTQSLIGNIAKIGLGLLTFKPSGMIVGQFLSQSAGITSFVKDAKKDFKAYLPKVQHSKEKLVAKYYQDFVWFRLPSQFLMVLSLQAPILMAAYLYDGDTVGQLSFTMMALTLPVSLIGMAMSKAYYAEIAKIGKNNRKKIKKITIDIQKKLFLVAIPISLFVFFLSEWIFIFVFGEKWQTAGVFASVLSPFLLLRFTSTPLDQVFNVLGSQVIYLVINVLRVVGFAVVFWVCFTKSIEPIGFVYALSWFMAGHYLFVTILVIYIVNVTAGQKSNV